MSTLQQLKDLLEGDLFFDNLYKTLYATDASVYRELPIAVAFPKSTEDLQKLVQFASSNDTYLIPRSAGTSLAGQCVGDGIVVDTGRFMKSIISINVQEKWVEVEPGVVRDDLNKILEEHGLFFSPITSTANRAMIGGMIGNNSCGTNSIKYGSTRDKIIEVTGVLSDATIASFGPITNQEFFKHIDSKSLIGKIYGQIYHDLSDEKIRSELLAQLPPKSIKRRNTGYAIDSIMDDLPFSPKGERINLAKLLCGSEGTLMLTSKIKIALDDLPPKENVVVAVHFDSLEESLRATQVVMKHEPYACELMDKTILDCTKQNKEINKYRFFVSGDPMALLLIEMRAHSLEELNDSVQQLIASLKNENKGYAYPIIDAESTHKVWKLRSAGLGVLANLSIDKKAVACIEDTAVDIDVLPQYIDEFADIMQSFGQDAVYYAHVGAGEIHLRPILNLKNSKEVEQFYKISKKSAELVKKYNGSLSGEHGDGRVRAPFIPLMVGESVYSLFKRIKLAWDPKGIFNRGKILDAPPMNENLRYEPDRVEPHINTIFNFEDQGGILKAAEQCNGSGDCRKSHHSGGVMCPSYMATHNEKDSTRGRANVLREFLTNTQKPNSFDHIELKEVMDLCISCKGCSSECPSNVDMSKLKAEVEYQYQKANGTPIRSKLFAYINDINSYGSVAPWLYNTLLGSQYLSLILKKILRVAPERSLPTLSSVPLRKWLKRYTSKELNSPIKEVYLFIDEFTNYNESIIGQKAVKLLNSLNYKVLFVDHEESGRSAFSKGILDKAKKHAERNVAVFSGLIDSTSPLIGIEPSCILSFRDEYPDIVGNEFRAEAKELKNNVYLIDEFLAMEVEAGNISSESFTLERKKILFHGHCHQKALSDITHTINILSLPKNYHVELIPSGCCGMAGSFGYEKEHYEISQKIGEMILYPAIRSRTDFEICATGTSCRHQIKDGTDQQSYHPIEILYEALV